LLAFKLRHRRPSLRTAPALPQHGNPGEHTPGNAHDDTRIEAVKDDRLKIPVDPDYTSALGLAVYVFAGLEWNAIRCCERLEAGSIDALMDRTAGRVADTFLRLTRSFPASETQRGIQQAASAKPGIDQDGRQRLFRNGDQWTIDERL